MKKNIAFILIILCLSLTLFACGTPTTYTKKDEYAVGEWISIYDNESDSELGKVKITNVNLIYDEPFTEEKIVSYDDNNNPVYKYVDYEGLVLIEYDYSVLDSTKKFKSSNFKIFDSEGKDAYEYDPSDLGIKVKSNSKHFVVAVKNIGDHVNIKVKFHLMQNSITTVKGYYDDSKYVTDIEDNTPDNSKEDKSASTIKVLTFICILEFSVIIFLLIMFVFVPNGKKKRLIKMQKAQRETLPEKSNENSDE